MSHNLIAEGMPAAIALIGIVQAKDIEAVVGETPKALRVSVEFVQV